MFRSFGNTAQQTCQYVDRKEQEGKTRGKQTWRGTKTEQKEKKGKKHAQAPITLKIDYNPWVILMSQYILRLSVNGIWYGMKALPKSTHFAYCVFQCMQPCRTMQKEPEIGDYMFSSSLVYPLAA